MKTEFTWIDRWMICAVFGMVLGHSIGFFITAVLK